MKYSKYLDLFYIKKIGLIRTMTIGFILIRALCSSLMAQPNELQLQNVTIVSAKSYTALNTITAENKFVVGNGGEVSMGAPDVYFFPTVKVAAGGELYVINQTIALSNDPLLNSLELEVDQNYPNPFTDQTSITYSLGKAGEVEIAVFDLLGSKISTLVSGFHLPGEHEVSWDAKDSVGNRLSSGVYIYRFETPNYQVSKRMNLLR
ncbi:MAG: T9SS type A sorting domain-containing protein [Bacteroidota bacterium]